MEMFDTVGFTYNIQQWSIDTNKKLSCTPEYYFAIKKNSLVILVKEMDLEMKILSRIRHKKYTTFSLLYAYLPQRAIYRQLKKGGSQKDGLSWEDHTNWLPSTK